MLPESTDEELAKLVQQGNNDAFEPLMKRFEPKLMRYGRRFMGRMDEDMLRQTVQDIFISVYQNIEGYDAGQRFSPWIYRIAHNAYVDLLRRKTRQPIYGFDFDTLISHPIHEDMSMREKESAEFRVLIEKGLELLTPAQREIIVLYYFEQLSYREIADVLHVPVSTVGVRLARARTALKKHLPDASQLSL